MATNIGVKIGVDGAAQFKSNLRKVDTELKSLSSEMKAATAEFQGNEGAAEALEKKQRILKDTMDAAQKKVEILSDEYQKQKEALQQLADNLQKAEEENGQNSEEAEKARQAFENQETATYKLKDQLNKAQTDMYNVKNAEKAIGDEADATREKTSTFGETLKAVLTADAIKTGLSAIADGIKKLGGFIWDTAKETGEYADQVQELAVKYNLTTDEVQEYMYMQELADTSVETIAGSLTKLTKNMGAAQDGTGSAAEAFDKLGVSITDSNGELRSSQDVFKDAIEALGNIENATERDTISMELFGKGAQDLNPLIELGAEGFQDLADKAHESGAVMSGEALQAAGEFKDGLDAAKEKADALKREIGEKLAPKFQDLLEKALDWAEGVDWDKVGKIIADAFHVIAGAVQMVIEDIKSVISWTKQAVSDVRDFIDEFRNSGVTTRDMWDYGSVIREATGAGASAAEPYTSAPIQDRTRSRARTIAEGTAISPFAATTGSARVVINTQSISPSTIDYVVAQVNTKLGANA